MLQSKARKLLAGVLLAGVVAIAAGIIFGWTLAGSPTRIELPTAILVSSAPIPSGVIDEREPVRAAVTPAPAEEVDDPPPAAVPAAAPTPATAAPANEPAARMVETGTDARVGKRRGGYRLDTPGTKVRVGPERGRVRVGVPYTSVGVDADSGRVRVRAPYVNLGIGW